MPGIITSSKTASWLVRLRPNAAATVRLVCFPYAGGGAGIFHGWPEHLPPETEVYAVQPPGREVRIKEPAIPRLSSLVRLLAPEIFPVLNGRFGFFGHSLGALVAFEVARELRRSYALHAEFLLLSGRGAPQVKLKETAIHSLPDDLLLEELRNMNGTPASVLHNAELMKLMLPTLRADLAACETYKYVEEPPLACRITAYGGAEDRENPRSALEAWKFHTTGEFRLEMFQGDHFFMNSARHRLLNSVRQEIQGHSGDREVSGAVAQL
jgi:medium-chain acyl-[acyl-carrier-protein] hydrolase